MNKKQPNDRKLFKTLRWKLAVLSTAIIMSVVLIIGMYAFFRISGMERENAVTNNLMLAQATADRFSDLFQEFTHQIDFVTLDGNIASYIEDLNDKKDETTSTLETYPEEKTLRSLITLRSIVMNEISGVFLYDSSGILITKWVKTPNRNDNYQLGNQTETEQYAAGGYVTYNFEDGHLIFRRAIRSLETREIMGYIAFIYDENSLVRRLRTIASNNMQFIGLYDDDNDILICNNSNDRDSVLRVLSGADITKTLAGSYLTVEGMGEMLFCGRHVANTDWYLLCAVPESEIQKTSSIMLLVILTFIVCGALLTLSIQVLNNRTIVMPLNKMTSAVKEIQNEHYDISINIRTGDEIEVLANSITRMAETIDSLVNQNLKAKIAQRETQLSLLQRQIEPHFLYNTLECINALAQMGRNDDVRTVTVSFSRLMKSQMDNRTYSTVKSELECAKSFLQIYKIMEGDHLAYSFDVDESCLSYEIPNLILQPLVENAVLHGIKPAGRAGSCKVEVKDDGEYIMLSVSDDGIGFPEKTLEAVTAYSERNATDSQKNEIGIGIRNLIDRLYFIYGDRAHITILSDCNWGTSIDLDLPKQIRSSQNSEDE